jgi:hypothetical protein
MTTRRKIHIALSICASAFVLFGCAFLALQYLGLRLSKSDLLWVGTKQVGMQLVCYARDHEGRFPATLDDPEFTNSLNSYCRAYVRHLRPLYTQPVTHSTNKVGMLEATTRWERVVCFSDGDCQGAHR